MDLTERDFDREITYKGIRSSGAGGQHVNKVSTKIELRFSVKNSFLLSDEEKERIHEKLSAYVNIEGELVITCQESRSQLKNKEIAYRKFIVLLTSALKQQKKRVKTKPSRSVREKRIQMKKMHAEKKERRKPNQSW